MDSAGALKQSLGLGGEHVSRAEQVANLGAVNQLLTAQGEIEELKAKLQQKERDHVSEISRIKKGSIDPVQSAIEMLKNYADLQSNLSSAQEQISELEARVEQNRQDFSDHAALADQQLESAMQLKEQKERAESEVRKGEAVITKLNAQVSAIQKQLNELKALDPKRLKKREKDLQKRNKILRVGNQRLRVLASGNKKAKQKYEDLLKDYDNLSELYHRTKSALDEAVLDLVDANKPKPIGEIGEWQIFGSTESDHHIVLVDTVTHIERPYSRESGFTSVRKPPAAVVKELNKHLDQISELREKQQQAAAGGASCAG